MSELKRLESGRQLAPNRPAFLRAAAIADIGLPQALPQGFAQRSITQRVTA
jgi:hypothetical protein